MMLFIMALAQKSIKYIVNKYHGNLAITNKNNLFSIDIIIPIQEKN